MWFIYLHTNIPDKIAHICQIIYCQAEPEGWWNTHVIFIMYLFLDGSGEWAWKGVFVLRRGTVIPGSWPSTEPPHSTYRKERFEPTIFALAYQAYELFGVLELRQKLVVNQHQLKSETISTFVKRVFISLSHCVYPRKIKGGHHSSGQHSTVVSSWSHRL